MFQSVTPNIDFPNLEKLVSEYWRKNRIVEKYLHKNEKAKKSFSFLDGPITANNPMGVHHAWGRTYKDLWQRYFTMRGCKQRYQNGFDCQGLWIEVEVEKELGVKNKKDIENLIPGDKKASIAKFVTLCKERVKRFSAIQTEQSKRLGYFMDWDHSYYTMSDANNYMNWFFLKVCHENGWIYKGRDSVPWCPRCQTAISQHEMLTEDYKELTHETVFLKLPIVNSQLQIQSKKVYLLVWTTTPWTVPANVAVGINVKFTYGIWEHKNSDEAVIFVDLDENGETPKRMLKGKEVSISEYIFTNVVGEWKKIAQISAKKLLSSTYQAPFDHLPRVQKARDEHPKTFHTVIDATEIVVAGEGTGLLHVAPGAGKEDFDLGKKENLSVISLIGDDASYLEEMEELSGKNAKKHPEIILDFLRKYQEGKLLLKTMIFTHRYPACWRCKTELVWKVEDEWYIAMDKKSSNPTQKDKKTLRQRMIEVAKKITWIPDFGLERELDWLNNMHDWLISKKNRYWGLALPIYECLSCGSFDLIGSLEELKKKAVIGWDQFEGKSPHKPYIDEVKIKCKKCNELVSRIDDVGNVWLDAGIVPFSTLVDPKSNSLSYTTDKKYWREWFPVDFITESFPGQFKNWFYSMIAMSTVLEHSPPFKTVLGYASVLGEDGRPMHKSWGNAIEFNEGADKIGVDVMRWMFATHDPEQNILFGYRSADETRRKFHLLLWNIYNFFITYANIDSWTIKEVTKSKHVLDCWILSKLHRLILEITTNMDDYNASSATSALESFVTDFSQWYVRRSRERVGPSASNGKDKDACYSTLYRVLLTLSQLLAPFVPYLSESIYTNLTKKTSLHLSDWPKPSNIQSDEKLEEQMKSARFLVELGHAKRKAEGIKVRKPIGVMDIITDNHLGDISHDIMSLVLMELNVKNLKVNGALVFPKKEVEYSEEKLIQEGQAREIIRQIQIKRKELGCRLDDRIVLTLVSYPEEFEKLIKKETLALTIEKGSTLLVRVV